MKPIMLTRSNFDKAFKIKQTSVRLGVKTYILGPSVVVSTDNGEVKQCIITNVRLMKVYELDHRHALRDGFHSLGELFKELERHYGKLKHDDDVTVVTFESTKDSEYCK
ncbi:ASCH domain protein [Vibrio phage 1.205.O._10N.222.51.A7]|nr:ASCH domain protein [Vibrio phage 1.205.O._10N.222.51.A7]